MKEFGKESKRLLSLDALRGFDMFFIMGGSALILSLSVFLPESFSAIVSEQMLHKLSSHE